MKILFITHDVSRSGAPNVILHFLKWVKKYHPEINADIVTLSGGSLEDEFLKYSRIFYRAQSNYIYQVLFKVFNKIFNTRYEYNIKVVRQLQKCNYDIIYANTVLSLPFANKILNRLSSKTKFIAHIHELNTAINLYLPDLEIHLSKVNHIITVSEMAKKNLIDNRGLNENKISVVYPPAQIVNLVSSKNEKKYFEVGSSGYVSWTKGYDVFIQIARYVKKHHPNKDIRFTWVGNLDKNHLIKINFDIDKAGLNEMVSFIGEKANAVDYYQNFDVFLLTSREESFSIASLEACMLGKPIICFDKAVGISELMQAENGFIVPYMDIEVAAEKIIYYYNYREIMESHGERNRVQFSHYTPEELCPEIYKIIEYIHKSK